MKTTLKVLLVAAAFTFTVAGASAQQLKIGYTNTQQIMMVMPEIPEIEKNLQSFNEDLNNQYTALTSEWTTKAQDYQKKMSTYSETVRADKENELGTLRDRIAEFEQKAEQDVTEKRAELLKPVYEKLEAAIKGVSEAEGFSYIFDEPYVLFINKLIAVDVTPQIKAKLGL